jgi:hypothetical protein
VPVFSDALTSVSVLASTESSSGGTVWPTAGSGGPLREYSLGFARLYGIEAANSAVPAAFTASGSFAAARASAGFTDGPLTVARDEDFTGLALVVVLPEICRVARALSSSTDFRDEAFAAGELDFRVAMNHRRAEKSCERSGERNYTG